jgi:hypothetical protein
MHVYSSYMEGVATRIQDDARLRLGHEGCPQAAMTRPMQTCSQDHLNRAHTVKAYRQSMNELSTIVISEAISSWILTWLHSRRRWPRRADFFHENYKSAAVHYSLSSHCNKSMRGIKAVIVQLNTRPHCTLAMAPQYVGDGEAGGGGAPGAWRHQPAPSLRAGAMI